MGHKVHTVHKVPTGNEVHEVNKVHKGDRGGGKAWEAFLAELSIFHWQSTPSRKETLHY